MSIGHEVQPRDHWGVQIKATGGTEAWSVVEGMLVRLGYGFDPRTRTNPLRCILWLTVSVTIHGASLGQFSEEFGSPPGSGSTCSCLAVSVGASNLYYVSEPRLHSTDLWVGARCSRKVAALCTSHLQSHSPHCHPRGRHYLHFRW